MTRLDLADTWYSRPAARHWRCARPPESALAFHAGLPGYRRTPLVEQPALTAELGVGRVLVKDESSRLGLPAFKMLGASWAVARLLAGRGGLTGSPTLEQLRHASAARPATLVAATDGNHGRAVARMASMLGLDARIFVPRAVPEPAVTAIAGEGAAVTRVDGPYDLAVQHAVAYAAARPEAELIQDMAWPGYQEVPQWIAEGYWPYLHAGLDAAVSVSDAAAAQAVADLARLGVPSGPCGAAALAGARAALTGAGSPARRADLGIDATSVIVLLSTEGGRAANVSSRAVIVSGRPGRRRT